MINSSVSLEEAKGMLSAMVEGKCDSFRATDGKDHFLTISFCRNDYKEARNYILNRFGLTYLWHIVKVEYVSYDEKMRRYAYFAETKPVMDALVSYYNEGTVNTFQWYAQPIYDDRSKALTDAERQKWFESNYGFDFQVIHTRHMNQLAFKYTMAKRKPGTPVYLVLDDDFIHHVEEIARKEKRTIKELSEIYLKEALAVHVPSYFKRKEEIKKHYGEYIGYDDSVKHTLELMYWIDDDKGKDILLVQVPTDKPYELLGHIFAGTMPGGPTVSEQIAISKYWEEIYGAHVAVISKNVLEYEVDRPPTTLAGCKDLIGEHTIFDKDIEVPRDDDMESIRISSVYDNCQWFFLWEDNE